MGRSSGPDVSFAYHNPFIGGQFLQAHRPPRMEFLGADGDFRAQPQLAAVGKARRGVDIDDRRIDLVQKTIDGGGIVRQNTVECAVLCC